MSCCTMLLSRTPSPHFDRTAFDGNSDDRHNFTTPPTPRHDALTLDEAACRHRLHDEYDDSLDSPQGISETPTPRQLAAASATTGRSSRRRSARVVVVIDPLVEWDDARPLHHRSVSKKKLGKTQSLSSPRHVVVRQTPLGSPAVLGCKTSSSSSLPVACIRVVPTLSATTERRSVFHSMRGGLLRAMQHVRGAAVEVPVSVEFKQRALMICVDPLPPLMPSAPRYTIVISSALLARAPDAVEVLERIYPNFEVVVVVADGEASVSNNLQPKCVHWVVRLKNNENENENCYASDLSDVVTPFRWHRELYRTLFSSRSATCIMYVDLQEEEKEEQGRDVDDSTDKEDDDDFVRRVQPAAAARNLHHASADLLRLRPDEFDRLPEILRQLSLSGIIVRQFLRLSNIVLLKRK
eukprot:PhM_4_TR4986/c0_g1_i1/m.58771